jgi:3-methyladenine DNA glycosylase AlkD
MARYGIVAPKVYGVSMATMKSLAKKLGKNHELALALWDTGWYEARILTSFVDEPAKVTPAQMDDWAHDFDNWAVCDTVCFHLFDKSPHAWKKIRGWSRRRDEFVKRAAFALLAAVALHDRKESDKPFFESLEIVDREAGDSRNFVKKGVSWALRTIGHRNIVLHSEAVGLANKLAASDDSARRWVGKDVLRDLMRPAIVKKLQSKSERRTAR